MADSNSAQYSCPLCQQPLAPVAGGFACPDNHRFDNAKEGYVNLLPVHHKGSKVPGDDKSMVMARRTFLDAGLYAHLQEALVALIDDIMPADGVLIDSGCGEGYYTNALSKALPEASVYGIDIAKPAVRYASKRSDKTRYAVASSKRLPFANDFADVLSKVFAPVEHDEVIRVLKPGGLFVSVVPGPQHLFELKEVIYDTPKPHEPEAVAKGFQLLRSKRLEKQVEIKQENVVEALLAMTPFAWKLSQDKRQRILQQDGFSITFDFSLNVYGLE